jgi:hypothetical protein
MKRLFLYLLAGNLFTVACNSNSGKPAETAAATTADTKGTAAMTFEKMVHSFGEVKQGEVVEYSFKFTNTGDKDLIITDAHSTCGCTVPDWPKEPIRPGKSSYMKVAFNSAGKEGFTEKELTIVANTNPAETKGPKIQCTVVK